MKLYLLDNADRLVRIIDTEENGSSYIMPIYEVKHHLFTVGENSLSLVIAADHPDAILFKEGNKIAYQDVYNNEKWHVFNILWSKDRHNNNIEKEVYCEHVFLDLLYEPILDMHRRETAKASVTRLISNTLWQIGFVAPRLDTEIHVQRYVNMNTLLCLRDIESSFNCELQFRIMYNQEANRLEYFIDLFERIGLDRGKAFKFSKDIESVERHVDLSRVFTAVYGYGKYLDEEKDDPSNRVTFAEVEWSVENGQPVNKPYGELVVKDEAARAQYGLYGGTVHRFGILDDERYTNQESLLQDAWDLLQANNKPYVSYQTKVLDLYRLMNYDERYQHERVEIGDTVTIIDHYFQPAMIERVRAVEMTLDLLNPANTDIVLGSHRRDGLGSSGSGSSLGSGNKLTSGGSGESNDTGDRVKHMTLTILDDEHAYNYSVMSEVFSGATQTLPPVATGEMKYKVLIAHGDNADSKYNAQMIKERFEKTAALRNTYFVTTLDIGFVNASTDDFIKNWNCIINIATIGIRNGNIDLPALPIVTNSPFDFNHMNGIFYDNGSLPAWNSTIGEIYRTTPIFDDLTHEIFGDLAKNVEPDIYRLTWGSMSDVASLIPQAHYKNELQLLAKGVIDNPWDDNSYPEEGGAAWVSDKTKIIRYPRAFLGAFGTRTSSYRADAIEIFFNMAMYLMNYFGRPPVANGYDGGEKGRNVAYVDIEGFLTFSGDEHTMLVENDSYVPSYKMNPRILIIGNGLNAKTTAANLPIFYNEAVSIQEMDGKEVQTVLYDPAMDDEALSLCTVVITNTNIESIRHKFRKFTQFIIVNTPGMHEVFDFGLVPAQENNTQMITNTTIPAYSTVDSSGNTVVVHYTTTYTLANRYLDQSPFMQLLNAAQLPTKIAFDRTASWYMRAYTEGTADAYGARLSTDQGKTYFYPVRAETRKTIDRTTNKVISTTTNDEFLVYPQFAPLVVNDHENAAYIQIQEATATFEGIQVITMLLRYMIRRITKLGATIDLTRVEPAMARFTASDITAKDVSFTTDSPMVSMPYTEHYVTIKDRDHQTIQVEYTAPIENFGSVPRVAAQRNLSDSHNVLILYNPNNSEDVANATIAQNLCNEYLYSSTVRAVTSYKQFMEMNDMNAYTVAVGCFIAGIPTSGTEEDITYSNNLRQYLRDKHFLPMVILTRQTGTFLLNMNLSSFTSVRDLPTSYVTARLDNADHITGRYVTDPSIANPIMMLSGDAATWKNYYITQDITSASLKRIAGIPSIDAVSTATNTAAIWESSLSNTAAFGFTNLTLLRNYQNTQGFVGAKYFMGLVSYIGQRTLDDGLVFRSYSGNEILPDPNADNIELDFVALMNSDAEPSKVITARNAISQAPNAVDVMHVPVEPTVTTVLAASYRKVLAVYKPTSSGNIPSEYTYLKNNGFYNTGWIVDYVSYADFLARNKANQWYTSAYDFMIVADEGDVSMMQWNNYGPRIPVMVLSNKAAREMGLTNSYLGVSPIFPTDNSYVTYAKKAKAANALFFENMDLAVPGASFNVGATNILAKPTVFGTGIVGNYALATNVEPWIAYGSPSEQVPLVMTGKTSNSKTIIWVNMEGQLSTMKVYFPSVFNTAKKLLTQEMPRLTPRV